MAAPAAAQNLRISVLGGYRRLMRLRKRVRCLCEGGALYRGETGDDGGLTHTDAPTQPMGDRLLAFARQVFAGDQYAIDQARQQLRVEFMRHKDVRDPVELRKSVARSGWMDG